MAVPPIIAEAANNADQYGTLIVMSTAPTPTAFQHIDGQQRALLVLCDHASNQIPPELENLGLAERLRRDHMAWDIGAAGVALHLSRYLSCPAFLGGTSRLVADLNRHPESPELMLVESDNHIVPGNLRIADRERLRRISCYHTPYHAALDKYLDQQLANGNAPALISIHSYTPEMLGLPRPWLLGLLWQQRAPYVDALLRWFSNRGWEIGDNHPYDGRDALGYSLERHALRRGLPHVLLELRQDQVYTPQLQRIWALRIADALCAVGLCEPRASALSPSDGDAV